MRDLSNVSSMFFNGYITALSAIYMEEDVLYVKPMNGKRFKRKNLLVKKCDPKFVYLTTIQN